MPPSKADKKSLFGWVMYDFANSAFATTVLAVIFNRYFAEVIAGGQTGTLIQTPFGSYTVPGSALWSFLVAISTAVVAISSPLLGAMADIARYRKQMLVAYCYIGVLATIGLGTVGSGELLTGSLLFIVANLGFAGGNVFYNAFLVDVSNKESFGKVSGLAWGIGYLGGGMCLVLNLLMLQSPELLGFPSGYFDVGDCIMVSGLWWGLFAIPTVLWVKQISGEHVVQRQGIIPLAVTGWRRVVKTFKEIRQYRQLVRFLVANLLFNDGVETVIVMAAVFGSEVVRMDTTDLVIYFIMIQGTAMLGALFFGWLSDRIGNKKSLLITLAVWLGIVVWAYFLGWLTDPRTEYYAMGILAGLVMGGSQSAARAMQALFTPPDKATEFFGFFAISGKFASIFGPLIYGAAIIIGGDIRSGILSLSFFFLAGGLILWFVDEKEGEAVASRQVV